MGELRLRIQQPEYSSVGDKSVILSSIERLAAEKAPGVNEDEHCNILVELNCAGLQYFSKKESFGSREVKSCSIASLELWKSNRSGNWHEFVADTV